ncbi:MAG TPA: SRPBCC family protein [Acidimicrobiales bacterium]|nr:SRPBCC family protein [Acidimicrobiales bacterium]
MAENTTTIDATPEQIFEVLLDAWTYKDWVVGADQIRAVDPDWPRAGSAFHHTVGVGPAKVDDLTKIVAVDAPRRLVLEARARPAGVAHVEFVVEPAQEGRSTVTIEEHPIDGPAAALPEPIVDAGLKLRNVETLRRLRRLVEERVGAR